MLRRHAVWALLVIATLPRAVRAQSSASAGETVLLEVRIGEVVSATLRARRVGDDALLPLEATLALAQLRAPIPSDSADRFVSLDTVRARLHESMSVDWETLTVTISDSHTLPVSRRALRAALRDEVEASSRARARRSRTRVALTPTTVSLDYSLATDGDPTRDAAATLHAGVAVLGGVLDAGWSGGRASSAMRAAGSATWLRPFDGPRFIRQLRIGNLVPPLVGRLRDAILVANAPLIRDADFGTVSLYGVATPGAEIDIFVNDRLVAWAAADSSGTYALRTRLTYGVNRVVIVATDVHAGTTVSTARSVFVADDALATGTLYYLVASGRCASVHCRRASVADLRGAPSDRVTLGATLAVRDSATSDMQAELGASVRVSDLVTGALHAQLAGAIEIGVAAGASPGTTAAAVLRWEPRGAAPGTTQPAHVAGTGSLDWMPRASSGVAVRASLAYGTPFVHAARARLAVAYARSFVRLESFARVRTGRTERASSRAIVVPGIDVGVYRVGIPQLASLRVTADRDAQSLAASLASFGGMSVNVGATWSARAPRPTIDVSLVRAAAIGRYAAFAHKVGEAPATMRHTIDGSLSADVTRARVRTVAHSGYATLRGRVFVDVNRNGVRDPGEPTIAGAELAVGDVHVTTDDTGEYVARGLIPFVSLAVRVTSLPSGAALPLAPLRVQLVPEGVAVLDVALDPA